jgi:hypothetical protein
MDWLMVFVIVAIVGQFVLIVYLQAKQAKETNKLIAQAKARMIEEAAQQQEAAHLDQKTTSKGNYE